MSYEDLLELSDLNGLSVHELPLQGNKGRIIEQDIFLKADLNTTEKTCILAEEIGHYFTGVGDILDQANVANRKQEYQGRKYAYNKLIGLNGIIQAFEHHCNNTYEMASFLNVTEEFLNEAINSYRRKYGVYTILDKYIIYFIPNLGILKML